MGLLQPDRYSETSGKGTDAHKAGFNGIRYQGLQAAIEVTKLCWCQGRTRTENAIGSDMQTGTAKPGPYGRAGRETAGQTEIALRPDHSHRVMRRAKDKAFNRGGRTRTVGSR